MQEYTHTHTHTHTGINYKIILLKESLYKGSILEKQKGITIIALIITIIVLLILAGVTIAALSGENGLLTKVGQASEKYKIEAAREKIQIAIISYQANKEHATLYDELLGQKNEIFLKKRRVLENR